MIPKIANNSETVRNSVCLTVTTIVGRGQADLLAQCTLTLTYIFKVKLQIFVNLRRTFVVTFSVIRDYFGMVLHR
jgi:riboflavin synthase alpha subunit